MPKTIEEFKHSCLKKRCLRNTIYNDKTCKTNGKQERCFEKYLRKQEKDKEKLKDRIVDKDWQEVLDIIHTRDKTCVIWKVLTVKERQYVVTNHFDEYRWLSKTLDGAHVIGRNNKQYKYNPNNVLLINRYFHRLLTDHKDPITQEYLTKEEVMNWYYRGLKFVHGIDINNERELKEWLNSK